MTRIDWLILLDIFNILLTLVNVIVLVLSKFKPEIDYRILSEYSGDGYVAQLREQDDPYGIDYLGNENAHDDLVAYPQNQILHEKPDIWIDDPLNPNFVD